MEENEAADKGRALDMKGVLETMETATAHFQAMWETKRTEAENALEQKWTQYRSMEQRQRTQESVDGDNGDEGETSESENSSDSLRSGSDSGSESDSESEDMKDALGQWFLTEVKNVFKGFHHAMAAEFTATNRTLLLSLEDIRFYAQSIETELSSWKLKYQMKLYNSKDQQDQRVHEMAYEWDRTEQTYQEQIELLQRQLATQKALLDQLEQQKQEIIKSSQADIKRVLAISQPIEPDSPRNQRNLLGPEGSLQQSIIGTLNSFQQSLSEKLARSPLTSPSVLGDAQDRPRSNSGNRTSLTTRTQTHASPFAEQIASEMDILRFEMQQKLAKFEAVKSADESAKADAEELRFKKQLLENKLAEAESTIRRLNSDLQKQATSHDSLRKEIQKLLQNLAESEGRIAEGINAMQQVSKLEAQLGAKENAIQQLRKQKDSLVQSEAVLRQLKEQHEKEIDALRRAVEAKEAATLQGSSTQAQLESQISSLKSKIKEMALAHQHEMNSLKTSNEDMRREKDEIQRRISTSRGKPDGNTGAIAISMPKWASDNSSTPEHLQQIDSLRKVNEELSINLSALTLRLREEEAKAMELDNKVIELTALASMRQQQVEKFSTFSNENVSLKSKLQELARENQELKGRYEADSQISSPMKTNITASSSSTKTRESIGGELSKMRGFLEDEQEYLMKIVDEMETWKEEFYKESSISKSLQTEVQLLQEKLNQAEAAVKQLQEKYQAEYQARRTVETEKQTIQSELASVRRNLHLQPPAPASIQNESVSVNISQTEQIAKLSQIKNKVAEIRELISSGHKYIMAMSANSTNLRSLSSKLRAKLSPDLSVTLDSTLDYGMHDVSRESSRIWETELLLPAIRMQLEDLQSMARDSHAVVRPADLLKLIDQVKRLLSAFPNTADLQTSQQPNRSGLTPLRSSASDLVSELADEIASWDVRFYMLNDVDSQLVQEIARLAKLVDPANDSVMETPRKDQSANEYRGLPSSTPRRLEDSQLYNEQARTKESTPIVRRETLRNHYATPSQDIRARETSMLMPTPLSSRGYEEAATTPTPRQYPVDQNIRTYSVSRGYVGISPTNLRVTQVAPHSGNFSRSIPSSGTPYTKGDLNDSTGHSATQGSRFHSSTVANMHTQSSAQSPHNMTASRAISSTPAATTPVTPAPNMSPSNAAFRATLNLKSPADAPTPRTYEFIRGRMSMKSPSRLYTGQDLKSLRTMGQTNQMSMGLKTTLKAPVNPRKRNPRTYRVNEVLEPALRDAHPLWIAEGDEIIPGLAFAVVDIVLEEGESLAQLVKGEAKENWVKCATDAGTTYGEWALVRRKRDDLIRLFEKGTQTTEKQEAVIKLRNAQSFMTITEVMFLWMPPRIQCMMTEGGHNMDDILYFKEKLSDPTVDRQRLTKLWNQIAQFNRRTKERVFWSFISLNVLILLVIWIPTLMIEISGSSSIPLGFMNFDLHKFVTAIVIGSFLPLLIFKVAIVLYYGERDRTGEKTIDQVPNPTDRLILIITVYEEGEEELSRTFDSIYESVFTMENLEILIILDKPADKAGEMVERLNKQLFAENRMPSRPADRTYWMVDGAHRMKEEYFGYFRDTKARITLFVKERNKRKRDSLVFALNYVKLIHDDTLNCVMFLDADTRLHPHCLSHMLERMTNPMLGADNIVAGCGEAIVYNQKRTVWTKVQTAEYFAAHAIGKVFESSFGMVTCLPGCCSIYKIAFITEDQILTNIARGPHPCSLLENNLLELGEDRYMTSLLHEYLRTHSEYSHKQIVFFQNAKCDTYVPVREHITAAMKAHPKHSKERGLRVQRRRWNNSTMANLLVALKMFGPKTSTWTYFCIFPLLLTRINQIVYYNLLIEFVGGCLIPCLVVHAYATIGFAFYRNYIFTGTFGLGLSPWETIFLFFVMLFIVFMGYRYNREETVGFMPYLLLLYPAYMAFLCCYTIYNLDDFSWDIKKKKQTEDDKRIKHAAIIPNAKEEQNVNPIPTPAHLELQESSKKRASLIPSYFVSNRANRANSMGRTAAQGFNHGRRTFSQDPVQVMNVMIPSELGCTSSPGTRPVSGSSDSVEIFMDSAADSYHESEEDDRNSATYVTYDAHDIPDD